MFAGHKLRRGGSGKPPMELTFEYSDYSTTGGEDVSVSGQVAAGDIIVFSSVTVLSSQNQSTPSGFTSIVLDNSALPKCCLAYKESTGSEGTIAVPANSHGIVSVYRPSRETTTISYVLDGFNRGSPPASVTIGITDNENAKIGISTGGIAGFLQIEMTGTGITQIKSTPTTVRHIQAYRLFNSNDVKSDYTVGLVDKGTNIQGLAGAYIEVE